MSTTPPVAVVTGASSGIGRATAKRLARQGYRVVLVARGREALQTLAKEIEGEGGRAVVEALDASDGAAVLALASRVEGPVEVLVNSAGAGRWRFLEETSPAEAVEMMGAPYFAAFNATRAFLPGMLARRRGVVLHVGSPAARMPWPGATAYTAARFALLGLHEALCQDLRGTGVRSTLVIFGKVTSEYFARNAGSEEHIPAFAGIIPVSTPEKCAEVISRALVRRRTQVVHPFLLRVFYWISAVLPGLPRWLLAVSGRRHRG